MAQVAGVLVAFANCPVVAQQITYTGSVSYSRGSYVFAEPTSSVWLTNGLGLRGGPVSLSASLPMIVQNSGIVSFVAGQPMPTGGAQSGAVGGRGKGDRIGTGRGSPTDSTVVFRDRYEIEVGDPILNGALEIYRSLGFVRSVSLQGGAKPPLRSLDSGVGTGEWDFGAGATLIVGSRRALVLGNASYWSFGDLPDLELNGALLYTVGVARSVMDARASILLNVSGATRIMETVDPPFSAGVSLLYTVSEGRMVNAGLSVGFTEASPDYSILLGWGFVF
jgi:hypothetical protein